MLWIYAGLILIGFMPLMIVIFKISKVKKMKRLGVKTTGIVKDVPMGTLRGLNRVMIEYEVKGKRNHYIKGNHSSRSSI